MQRFIILILILNFMGCATSPSVRPTPPHTIPGVYHRVERKETLWKISKAYNVDLDEIVKLNHISDASAIETGQLIFIPRKPSLAYAPVKPTAYEDFIWPVRGKMIASFGQTLNNMLSQGITIKPSEPKVAASRSGKVVFYAASFKTFGSTIIIDHGDGLSTVYSGKYNALIKVGDRVEKGAVIAKIGLEAEAQNNYLYFQIRKKHKAQNPYFYLPRHG